MYAYVLPYDDFKAVSKNLLDHYDAPTISSINWKHWIAQLDTKICFTCRGRHGEIYHVDEAVSMEPPVHVNCRCIIKIMEAVLAGDGTKDGKNGADWWIKNRGSLPEYYISENELNMLGWRRGKALAKFAPGKMATMGIYRNDDGYLPRVSGRIWYEADINYYSGKRNKHRLLWSNDGLIFVTYNHYETFIEVI